jgi:hypothetical protein
LWTKIVSRSSSGWTIEVTPEERPEALISGREEIWLRYSFSSWCYNPQLFSGAEIAEYVRAFSQPGALRGAFNDYRAGPAEVVQDEEDEGFLIECPTVVLWGEEFATVAKCGTFVRLGKGWLTTLQAMPQSCFLCGLVGSSFSGLYKLTAAIKRFSNRS